MCLLTNDGDHHGELFLISCPNNSRRGIISTFSNIIGYKEVVKSFKVSLKRLRGWIMGVMPSCLSSRSESSDTTVAGLLRFFCCGGLGSGVFGRMGCWSSSSESDDVLSSTCLVGLFWLWVGLVEVSYSSPEAFGLLPPLRRQRWSAVWLLPCVCQLCAHVFLALRVCMIG